MRIPFVAGNWKMNTTAAEAERLVLEMLEELDRIEGVEKVLCPPFVSLVGLSMMLQSSSIRLGAQNMYFEAKGAYTGEISPLMLRELCDFVILGHSERRWYFGETDEIVNNKVKAALANRLKPILCVGERLEENEAGKTEDVVSRQVTTALNGIEPVVLSTAKNLVIAYEPVWAIGTGRAANGKQAAATIQFIRDVVAKLWNKSIAQDLRILYGGSVTGANIAEFISHPEIDGALVGGASLKADEFVSIVEKTAEIKKRSSQ
ncbi:MAG: triose-phosphate isomerase [Chloroflexi bacterium RBG_13_50_10]|nr:MAG: triose-phosphate isomerase [Chloroflexi bacterium RBG_13_50_10]